MLGKDEGFYANEDAQLWRGVWRYLELAAGGADAWNGWWYLILRLNHKESNEE
jgi:hypothetical protein